jgi:transcription termination factor NusB
MSDTLEILNNYFTYLFLYEMLSKIIAFGIKKYSLDRMNLLDGTVVLLSVFEIIYSNVVITSSG